MSFKRSILLLCLFVLITVSLACAADTECTSVREVGETLRESMINRESSVVIKYKAKEKISSSFLTDVLAVALEHTGNPKGGDYLNFQYEGVKYSATGIISSGWYRYDITFTMTYYTTAAQEKVVDSKIATILSSLKLTGKSDYEKVKAIYDYVCANVDYDRANLSNASYVLKYTAYGALVNKKAVCQGYSNLIYRLMLEAGIDCRTIAGTCTTGGHAWNIVKIGDKYYNIDSTWDAGKSGYDYFLVNNANFDDHTADRNSYNGIFWSNYTVDTRNFSPNADVTDFVNSWYGVTVKWSAANGATNYTLYRKAYGESSFTKIITTTALSYYDKAVVNNKSYTYKVVATKADGSSTTGTALTALFIAPPEISAVTNISTGAKVDWSVVPGAKGYYVYRKDGQEGTWHYISTAYDITYTDKTVENGKVYYYAIKSFNGDEKSASSSAKNTVYVSPVSISTLTNPTSKTMKVVTTGNSLATRYEVQYSTTSTFTAATTKTFTGTTSTTSNISGLTVGKTYYVRVRVVKVVAGYSFYSNYSAAKTIKIAK